MAKKTGRKKPAKTSRRLAGYKMMPPLPIEGAIVDKQSQFVRLTRAAPGERDSERIFLASKLEMLRTHPGLSETERLEAETLMARVLKLDSREALERRLAYPPARKKVGKKTPPVPGGVGYGMFYTNAFRTSF